MVICCVLVFLCCDLRVGFLYHEVTVVLHSFRLDSMIFDLELSWYHDLSEVIL